MLKRKALTRIYEESKVKFFQHNTVKFSVRSSLLTSYLFLYIQMALGRENQIYENGNLPGTF